MAEVKWENTTALSSKLEAPSSWRLLPELYGCLFIGTFSFVFWSTTSLGNDDLKRFSNLRDREANKTNDLEQYLHNNE